MLLLLVVYDSLMGKTERFAHKLGLPILKIHKDLIVSEPYVLLTYTCGHGEVPKTTLGFLEENHDYMVGVAVSGHRNWGEKRYGLAGDIISKKYNKPLIHKFEMSGYPSDVAKFKEGVFRIW